MAIMRKEVPSGCLSNAMLGNTLYLALQKFKKKHHLNDAERSVLEKGQDFFKRATDGRKAFENRLMGWSAVEDSAIYGTVLEVVRHLKTQIQQEGRVKFCKDLKTDSEAGKFINHFLETFDKILSQKPPAQEDLTLLLRFFKTLRTKALKDWQRQQPYERVHTGVPSR